MAEVVVTLLDLLELQRRHDNSAEAPGITIFTWKIHKFLASTTKQNLGIPNLLIDIICARFCLY